jgi:hypothetical protein
VNAERLQYEADIVNVSSAGTFLGTPSNGGQLVTTISNISVALNGIAAAAVIVGHLRQLAAASSSVECDPDGVR